MHKVPLEDLIVRQEDMPFFSRKLLEKHQLELLNTQLKRAKAVSPFYKYYPDKVASLEELSTLPFITAQELRENYSKLCLSSLEELTRVRTEYTSGTVGAPKKMAYSDYDSARTTEFFANGLAELIFPGDKVIICFPYTDSLSLGGLIGEAVRRIGAVPLLPGHDRSYGEFLDIIRENEANVYLGPPVLLLSLLRLQPDTTLKRALVSGDHCSETVLSFCEEILGSKLFPHYGLRESGLGGAYTCTAHAGMHIRENDMICEIIDETGSPLPDGDWGELVITTIGLEAMPLFRYRTGDFARILEGTCPCGSEVKRLEVMGRISKNAVMGHYEDILFGFDNIIDFHISDNSVILSVRDNDSELMSAVQKHLRGFDVKMITAKLTDRPMYTGKRRIL
ncbi:MAG: AMP-binding protein [Oscillospiraceae bacterium]|nr:AMP-binding protein [Oscillospiraceae bacterium]